MVAKYHDQGKAELRDLDKSLLQAQRESGNGSLQTDKTNEIEQSSHPEPQAGS